MIWIFLIVATPVVTVAGYFSGLPWLLPILQIAPAYPLLVFDLREGRRGRAILRMLVWAALLAVTVEALALHYPERGAGAVFHGAAYRDEMIQWIRSGEGKESNPAAFLPEHALHLGAFVALSLATASLGSLLMGALLMNYMSFYVGSLMAVSERPWVALQYGWPPWAILRVVAFVILGVVLAGPLLRRITGTRFSWADQKGYLAAAAAGIVLDVVLKATLAPAWGRILRSALFPLSQGL